MKSYEFQGSHMAEVEEESDAGSWPSLGSMNKVKVSLQPEILREWGAHGARAVRPRGLRTPGTLPLTPLGNTATSRDLLVLMRLCGSAPEHLTLRGTQVLCSSLTTLTFGETFLLLT